MKKNLHFLLLYSCVTILFSCSHKSGTYLSEYFDNYDVTWNSPSVNSSESMPLGGGDIGCNVWVENGEIMLYIQRSGSISENGEYLKMGRLRIKSEPELFRDTASFSQTLNLEDGALYITSGSNRENNIRIWVDKYTHSVQFSVNTAVPARLEVAYENWRYRDRPLTDENRGRYGCFALEGYPGKIIKLKDSIAYKENQILFYHRNPERTPSPDIMLEIQGLTQFADQIVNKNTNRISGGMLGGKGFIAGKTGEGIYQTTPYRSWSIVSEKASRQQQFQLVTHIEQNPSIDAWKNTLDKNYREALARKGNPEKNAEWWQELWQRSWIVTDPRHKDADKRLWQMGRNYQLMRYQLATNFEGEFPSKFNGGHFGYDPVLVLKMYRQDPDWRRWGGDVFTAQNQRLLYWPLLKSGDAEGMHSQFNLYKWGLAGASLKVRQHFGHNGAFFCEYASASGLDFGAGWGWENATRRPRGKEIPFGDQAADATKGYGDEVEEGMMASPSVGYHWESQVEHSYMMLEYHRFTGKSIHQYMPFIKAALIFFDEHYQKRAIIRNGKPLDDNGKLIIYPSKSCESYRGAYNPSDLIAGLKSTITSLLSLEEGYLTIAEKTYFKGYLERIPDLMWGEENHEKILMPAYSFKQRRNGECPQFYPLFPFNLYNLESPEIAAFRNTWKYGKFPKGVVTGWHQDGVFFARMGMTGDALEYNKKKLADAPNRFPSFWGPGYDWLPDHNWGGSGMLGLQEMVLQTFGNKIYVLPAWPEGKDVCFKLHAPGQTTVEVEYIDGKIQKLEVLPESRRKDVVSILSKKQ